MASWIGLTRINASFGPSTGRVHDCDPDHHLRAVAVLGLANAAATMVGQALGAGKPERGEQAVWRAALYNVFFLGTAGLIFVTFADPIAGCSPPIRRSRRLRRDACASSATGTCSMPTGWF